MNTLIIDTATNVELVAASTPSLNRAVMRDIDISHAKTLFDSVEECLAPLGLAIQDINILGVGTGPGSFTGIRIAVSTTRMLAQILRVPLVGIPTQLLYASSMGGQEGDYLLVAFDAKKGRVFGALYQVDAGKKSLLEVMRPGDYQIDLMLRSIDANCLTRTAGDGIVRHRDRIDELLRHHLHLERIVPLPEKMREILIMRYDGNKTAYDNYQNTVPFYARKSDAEALKEKKGIG